MDEEHKKERKLDDSEMELEGENFTNNNVIEKEDNENSESGSEIPDIFGIVENVLGNILEEAREDNTEQDDDKKASKLDLGGLLNGIMKNLDLDEMEENLKNMSPNNIEPNTDENEDEFSPVEEKINKLGEIQPEKVFHNVIGKTKDIMEDIDIEKEPDEILSEVTNRIGESVNLGDDELNETFKDMFKSLSKQIMPLFSNAMQSTMEEKSTIIQEKERNQNAKRKVSVPIDEVNYSGDEEMIERLDRVLRFVSKIKIEMVANRLGTDEETIIQALKSRPDLFQRFKIVGEFIIK